MDEHYNEQSKERTPLAENVLKRINQYRGLRRRRAYFILGSSVLGGAGLYFLLQSCPYEQPYIDKHNSPSGLEEVIDEPHHETPLPDK